MTELKIAVFDNMEQCTEEEVQRLLPLVSSQRREQALRYKHTLGRFCCLKSWLMLKGLVDERDSGLMDEWEYNEYGKPSFIHQPSHAIHFSISHCKQGIAVVIDDQPVGIDIEAIRHADEELIERVMNEQERQQIRSNRDFTRLWTGKEAVVKAQGVGISSFEQLQKVLAENEEWIVESVEKENYIYSIAHK